MRVQIFSVYVCSGESILSLTLDPNEIYCEVLVSCFALTLYTELPWIRLHFAAGDKNVKKCMKCCVRLHANSVFMY